MNTCVRIKNVNHHNQKILVEVSDASSAYGNILTKTEKAFFLIIFLNFYVFATIFLQIVYILSILIFATISQAVFCYTYFFISDGGVLKESTCKISYSCSEYLL